MEDYKYDLLDSCNRKEFFTSKNKKRLKSQSLLFDWLISEFEIHSRFP